MNIPDIDEELSAKKIDHDLADPTSVKKVTSFSTKKRDPLKVSMRFDEIDYGLCYALFLMALV